MSSSPRGKRGANSSEATFESESLAANGGGGGSGAKSPQPRRTLSEKGYRAATAAKIKRHRYRMRQANSR